jgi:hypothetical protein
VTVTTREAVVAAPCCVEVFSRARRRPQVPLDQERSAPGREGGYAGGAGAGEGVDDQSIRRSEGAKDVRHQQDGLCADVSRGVAQLGDEEKLVESRVDRLGRHDVGWIATTLRLEGGLLLRVGV